MTECLGCAGEGEHECEYCEGTGRGNDGYECDECTGLGHIECEDCDGSGEQR